MNLKEISRFLATYFFIFGAFLLIPLGICVYYEILHSNIYHPQPHSALAFFYTILICLFLGTICHFYGRKANGSLFFRKEGYLSAILIWFISGIIGGLPFYLSHTLENPIDCYFEAISGFTTTGASVMYPKNINPTTGKNEPIHLFLSDRTKIEYTFYGNITPIKDPDSGVVLYAGLDALGRGILFWRGFMQWLGGMGIVVLFIAVLPAFGLGGNKLLVQAELPGPSKESLAPRAKDAASLLWKVYLALTLFEIILLKMFDPNMKLFDSIMISLSNISTGGFIPFNEGLEIYNSLAVQWILILFMILGSTNFTLIFYALRGKLYKLLEPEVILFLLTICIGSFLVIMTLLGTIQTLSAGISLDFTLGDAIRYGIFQYVAAQTSTGYSVIDYSHWSAIGQGILMTSMFIGGMSCSTAGGMKVIRYYILMRATAYRTEAIFKPDLVRSFKIKNQAVNQTTKETVLCFFFLVIAFCLVGTLIYIADGIDPRTALSSTAAMINNVGLGFGAAGVTQSFAFMSNFSKLASTFWMVLGRLEFFLILILFTPAFWRRN